MHTPPQVGSISSRTLTNLAGQYGSTEPYQPTTKGDQQQIDFSPRMIIDQHLSIPKHVKNLLTSTAVAGCFFMKSFGASGLICA